tara:strand:+ start:4507 stop:5496 length:990 start_codon:yes stop_codon:yes gene_type:complete
MITGKFPALRLRRSRKNDWSRRLIEENNLTPSDFILPIFLIEGKNKKQHIRSMPGVFRYTLDRLVPVVEKAIKNKLPMVALFPYIERRKKNLLGSEALNEDNLVCKAIQIIKKKYKDQIGIMCDVALDPYTSHGHDGLLKSGYVLNDETNEILIKQSLLQAQMGCDVLSPSDMMDGRVGQIRRILDKNGFHMTQILSYAVKYASSFYGPFRDAVGTKGLLKGNKKNYQMDYKNSNEAIREVALDIKEGADMVMVKPGLPYLDIIKLVKENFKVPVMAYQVSGEYSLLSNSINKGFVDKNVVIESLVAFKRAGANAIVSYYADRLDKILY